MYKIDKTLKKQTQQLLSNVLKMIEADGGFKEEYATSLDILAKSYELLLDSYAELKTSGLLVTSARGMVANPASRIFKDSFNMVQSILIQFGATPKSRKTIMGINADDTPSLLDKFIDD